MSRRKPLAGLAAVTAALALAVPAANASAATTAPARTASIPVGAHFSLGALGCGFLIRQLHFAERTGNIGYENFLGDVLFYGGCGGAAI